MPAQLLRGSSWNRAVRRDQKAFHTSHVLMHLSAHKPYPSMPQGGLKVRSQKRK